MTHSSPQSEPAQADLLPRYEEPEVRTWTEEDLKERFADILSSKAVFSDTHSSPGM